MNLPQTLIVGIGSPHGDDQAGWLAVRRVGSEIDEGQFVVREAASPVELLHWLDGVRCLIVCDAGCSGGPIGEITRWRWPLPETAAQNRSSTHGLTLPAVLQLAEQLGRLPRKVVIWTVEAGPGGALQAMSPQVEAALPHLAGEILREYRENAATPVAACTGGRI